MLEAPLRQQLLHRQLFFRHQSYYGCNHCSEAQVLECSSLLSLGDLVGSVPLKHLDYRSFGPLVGVRHLSCDDHGCVGASHGPNRLRRHLRLLLLVRPSLRPLRRVSLLAEFLLLLVDFSVVSADFPAFPQAILLRSRAFLLLPPYRDVQ